MRSNGLIVGGYNDLRSRMERRGEILSLSFPISLSVAPRRGPAVQIANRNMAPWHRLPSPGWSYPKSMLKGWNPTWRNLSAIFRFVYGFLIVVDTVHGSMELCHHLRIRHWGASTLFNVRSSTNKLERMNRQLNASAEMVLPRELSYPTTRTVPPTAGSVLPPEEETHTWRLVRN